MAILDVMANVSTPLKTVSLLKKVAKLIDGQEVHMVYSCDKSTSLIHLSYLSLSGSTAEMIQRTIHNVLVSLTRFAMVDVSPLLQCYWRPDSESRGSVGLTCPTKS